MKNLFTLILLLFFINTQAQVGIGTTNPNESSALDITSTDKGMLVPRLTSTQRNAIASPATGLLVYDTTAQGFWFYNGTAWTDLSSGSGTVGWALDGNAGTNPATDFVGTTDNVPLSFKVNNERVGHFETSGGVFLGLSSGNSNSGAFNTAIGQGSLRSNTSGKGNTATGYQTLYSNISGEYNTANGEGALYSNTTGSFNTANGQLTLHKNTTGSFNTATGSKALYSNTTGSSNFGNGYQSLYANTIGEANTAIGHQVLNKNISGSRNVANGYRALFENTTGSRNVANGYNNLGNNTTGSNNTANGYLALRYNTTGAGNTAQGNNALATNNTGQNNTALGFNADVSSADLTNATAIGYDAKVNASDKVRIGNTRVSVIEGQVAFTNPSDARFKYNVQNNVPGLAFITKLKPATYYFDNKKLEKFSKTGVIDQSWADTDGMVVKTGFLAQEVEQVAQEIGYDFDGINTPKNDKDKYTLAYSTFVVPLVKAVQEQQQIIDSLNEKINDMEAKLEVISQQMEASSASSSPSELVSN